MSSQLSQEVHLLDYLQVILKSKFIILACLLGTLTTSAIVNYITVPIYEAKSRILIDAGISSSPVTGVTMEYDRYIQFTTHFDLITSYPVLERVYNTLFLNKPKEEAIPDKEESISIVMKAILFITQNLSKAKQFIIDLFPSEEVDPFIMNNPSLWTTYKIRSLRGKIDVQQVKKTRLVDLMASHKNPKLAMDIANGFAQAYIEYTRSSNFEATKASIDWLSEQLDDMKKEIRISENKFNDFKRKERIFSIVGKQRIQGQKIAELTSAYSDNKSQRLAISATLKSIRGIIDTKKYDNLSLGSVDNPLLGNLHRDLVNTEIELAGLKNTFKYKHPQIIVMENKIEQTREKFKQELKRTQNSLLSEYAVLKDKEQTFLSTIQQYESDALDLNQKEMEYTMLEREVETNKKLYDLLFNNFTEANVIKAMPTTNIRLLEAAVYPLAPVKPQKMLNLILCTILGLMMGLGLSFFLEYLNRSINTPEDVELHLELPILSTIPKIPAKNW